MPKILTASKGQSGDDMAIYSKSVQDMRDIIKKNVKYSHEYFQHNYQRFHDAQKFIFKTNLTPNEITVLTQLDKPMMQFNILEAYVSRLCGEFAKMDPGFMVRAADGVELVDPRVIEVVEAHLKACFIGGDKDNLSYQIYRDLLSGGYSVAEIFTDYANDRSFDQKIYVNRVFDPTLCGFDPLARQSHKGDGRYAYQLFPKSAEEAKEIYGSDILKGVSFVRDTESFNWSYKNQNEDILLFCEYFCKKLRKTKILKLANGHVVEEATYNKFMEIWDDNGFLEPPPVPVKSRTTEIETIEKYTITGEKIINHERTGYKFLPLIFFDGNSVIVRDNENTYAEQMTRPYVYQAYDAQRMKNFAGQTLCNEIEGMVQSKWIAGVESIPDNVDYQKAYTDPQKATIILYNMFKDNNPDIPLQAPIPVQRQQIPPEISNVFMMADQVVQSVLGSYDAAIGVNENDISGAAIMQGAMHSNAAAMPYTMGFIAGWNRCAEVYVDLLPKYYVTPRTIPIIKRDGKHDYYEINKPGNVSFNYDASALEVKVETGVNFAVQKQMALKTIVSLMEVSEQFSAFMNQEGLEILLDNIDIRGIDTLKIKAAEWMQQQKELQQQQQEEQANQPTPEELMQMEVEAHQQEVQVQAMKVQSEAEASERKAEVELTKIATDDAIRNKELDIKFLEAMAKIQGAELDSILKQEKVDAENARTAVDMAISVAAHHHTVERSKEELKIKAKDKPKPKGTSK